MNVRIVLVGLLAAVLGCFGLVRPSAAETSQAPPKTPQAWTFDEAMQQFRLHPDDAYLQYVVLQLARNENKLGEVEPLFERRRWRQRRQPDRRVDLFGLFTGAPAVQESLQLDAMRETPDESTASTEKKTVAVADLEKPTIKSHPWGEMLAAQSLGGRTPEVSPLAKCVPADQYLVLFKSLGKLLDAADSGDLWGEHLLTHTAKSGTSQATTDRVKRQLAVRTDPLTRPFYDMVVEEVAITGNDLYFREGSDITVIFRLKQPAVFRMRMDGFLAEAQQSRADATRTTGTIEGVDYVQIATPDRAIHVFSAYPKPDLHVRSNSKVGLARVLRAIAGTGEVERLGETTEYKYIRTLMVRGDKREDGFVYLSDPFIRRMVGPEVKLTEQRRVRAYNHLRMIGHAAMLYRTQYGKKPTSLEQLAESGCAPGVFGLGELACPSGGTYRLSEDGTAGVSSIYGHARSLVPGCEVPVKEVTAEEAAAYREFLTRYNQYWRQFFDPIAIRLQVTPEQYRAETIILPLIDNSIYTAMAAAMGGEPEPLDAMPLPKRNIFSMNLRLNKEMVLQQGIVRHMLRDLEREGLPMPTGEVSLEAFLTRGIGNQIGLHVYDAEPMFDLNLTAMLGDVVGTFRGGRFDDDFLSIGFLVASLNAPVYVAVPVNDAEVVDKFLDGLDRSLATLARQEDGGGWFDVSLDFYRLPLPEGTDPRIRCWSFAIGPVKWRMFFARIDQGLYVASKREILEDLMTAKPPKETGPTAHGMVRLRPEHWDKVLSTFHLGWAESARVASLDNLGPLSNVARALRAGSDEPVSIDRVLGEAEMLYGVRFFCPGGGEYVVSDDGREVQSTIYGTAAAPRQTNRPPADSPTARLMSQFGGATAALTFLEDGLHAVVTIERK